MVVFLFFLISPLTQAGLNVGWLLGFIIIFLICCPLQVLSAFSYNSRFTKCHRILVNPGRLLKKIMRSTKQGNCSKVLLDSWSSTG